MQNSLSKFLFIGSYALIIAIIVSSPLLLGSNRNLPWKINAGLVAVAFVLWLIGTLVSREGIELPLKRIWLPFACLFVSLSWALFQWLPLDLEGMSNPVWAFWSKQRGIELAGRIAADEVLSGLSLMRMATYVGFAFLVLQFASDARKARQLLSVFVLSCALYAFYGLWSLTQGLEDILWMGPRLDKHTLTSTFVNRNNAATYFGLGSMVALIMLRQTFRERFMHQNHSRSATDLVVDFFASRVGGYLLLFCTLIGSLLLTKSRGGVMVSLISIAFALIISVLSTQSRSAGSSPKSYGRVFVNLFAWLAVDAFLLFEVSGHGVGARLFQHGVADESRWNVYRICLEIIADYSWTGTGLATFPVMFDFYRDETIGALQLWDKAHNSYLELIIGLGIPGAIIFYTSFVWAIWRLGKGLFTRQRNRYFEVIGLSATLLVGMHAMIDFSIEIQAVTFAYLLLLCIGTAQSWPSKRRS